MPISVTSAASAWVATTQKPIAPTNHRIMHPPDTPPRLDRRWRDALFAGTLYLEELLLRFMTELPALATPHFVVARRAPVTMGAVRFRPSTARRASAGDRS